MRGELLTELPPDLYIPPDALEVFLETFEGPLDLLLYLIRKANYRHPRHPDGAAHRAVHGVRRGDAPHKNLELAAEYLVMAAMLIEIKSRMLLPRPPAPEQAEPKTRAPSWCAGCSNTSSMKLAAQRLDALPQLGRDFLPVDVWIETTLAARLPQVNTVDLQEAWRALLTRAKMIEHHRVSREELSVREHMSLILRRLAGGAFAEFSALFDPGRGVAVLIVNFLALLELVRESLIEVTQAGPFAPIYVKLSHADSE